MSYWIFKQTPEYLIDKLTLGKAVAVMSGNTPFGIHRGQWVNSSPLDKMAAILANNIFKWIFLNENDKMLIQI